MRSDRGRRAGFERIPGTARDGRCGRTECYTRSSLDRLRSSLSDGREEHEGYVPANRVIVFDEDNFDDEVNSRRGPILVDFWASWCAPCKRVAPVLGELAEELAGRAHVAKVDVDDNGDLANRFGIRSVPTLVVFRGGRVVDQLIGAAPKDQIRAMIERHIRSGAGRKDQIEQSR
jgi:thioredoxin 1